MTSTKLEKIDKALQWIRDNGYWNSDILKVDESKVTSGVGVFIKKEKRMNEDSHILLLRIPKVNILSPKNSLIYNLLEDYECLGISDEVIDLTKGMQGLVISFIYEAAAGEESPWYDYIASIDPEELTDDDSSVPLCLWPESDKELLKNTECGMLGMLKSDELKCLFYECVRFAKLNKSLIAIPNVFDVVLPEEGKGSTNFSQNAVQQKLILFGKYVQCVISRAFDIDEFFGLSLVPGADLFNHIGPELSKLKYGINRGRENVHFECEGSNICGICGEQDCEDHVDSADEAETYSDITEEKDDSSSSYDEDIKSTIMKEEEYMGSLTENFSENETSHSDGEDSTSQCSDEDDTLHEFKIAINSDNQELTALLKDSSQCCDIVLVKMPDDDDLLEIFNTYGNFLSNPFLLQRYGFVSNITQPNPNDSCLLTVELFAYLKKFRNNSSKSKVLALDEKLKWYQNEGFEILNEQVLQHLDFNDENGEMAEFVETTDVLTPESWQLSPRILFDGSITPQTFALLKVLTMSHSVFCNMLSKSSSHNKLCKAIGAHLLPLADSKISEEMKQLLDAWRFSRKRKYTNDTLKASNEFRRHIIDSLIAHEISLLEKENRIWGAEVK